MDTNNVKTRLLIGMVIIAIVLGSVAAWLISQNNKPYKKRTVAETTLYIPVEYLGPKPSGMLEIMEEYMRGFDDVKHLSLSASMLLPDTGLFAPSELDTGMTLSIAPAAMMTVEGPLLKSDRDLLVSLNTNSPPQNEPVSDKLLKVFRNPEDKAAFALTNYGTASSNIPVEDAWISHCAEFRTIREDSSLGRCSLTVIDDDLRSTLYFDVALANRSGQLRDAMLQHIAAWQTTPTN